MSKVYYETVQLIERLHRHFLDVLKVEIERANIQDINNVQSMILYNIGTDDLTVGELTMRGYYLGSNVSYNVKKMVENGYLVQERSKHDRRSVRVKLSEKGIDLQRLIKEMIDQHALDIEKFHLDDDSLMNVNERLRLLERFWASRTSMIGSPLS